MYSSKEPFWAKPIVSRLSIFIFMIVVGIAMAANIRSKSLLGFLLSVISLGAGIYFIHLLQKLKESAEQEETS